jgi:dihydrofolate reductase
VVTKMVSIRGFIAASLDSYIATPDGGIEWLKPFEKFDYGYDRFIAEITTVVMGRKTYDQLPALGLDWPYPGKPGIVVTSRTLASSSQGVVAWRNGVESLIAHLRELRG